MELFLFIGTYTSGSSKGVYVYSFNEDTAEVVYVSQAEVENPSYMVLNTAGTNLYAVSENEAQRKSYINAFAFNGNDGQLTLLNAQQVFGGAPCYINIGKKDQTLVTANYLGGNISVFKTTKDGSLLEIAQQFNYDGSSVHPDRQQQAHLHSVVFSPDADYLFACDLGLDRIYKFEVNYADDMPFLSAGSPGFYEVEAGSGPRHLVFNTDGTFAYVICELSGKVLVFKYNEGTLALIQTVISDCNQAEGSADIHIHPNGKFLYTSNRLEDDGITIFSINQQTGFLTRIGYTKTASHPRNFCITPNGKFMLVANLNSDVVQIFAIDSNTGELCLHDNTIAVASPVCLKFIC